MGNWGASLGKTSQKAPIQRKLMDKIACELTARGPCFWCGYNGPNFFQEKTHQKYCPWYGLGGQLEREKVLLRVILEYWQFNKRFKIPFHDVEEYYKDE